MTFANAAPQSGFAGGTGPDAIVRPVFTGTGGGLFVQVLIGALLTLLTLGIYMPWFVAGLIRWFYENTTLQTPRGNVRLSFSGTGGQFFLTLLMAYVLLPLTLGLVTPWIVARLLRIMLDHTNGTAEDGTPYRLKYLGTGGGLFGPIVGGMLLTMITFGIYGAWFLVGLTRRICADVRIAENDEEAATFQFTGTGGSFFGVIFVGYLLTMITFGIYSFWMQVNVWRYQSQHTQINVTGGGTWRMDFDGKGGEYFVTFLVGYLLTAITLGIYLPWFMCKLAKFQIDHHSAARIA